MADLEHIEELVKLMRKHGLHELKLEDQNTKVSLTIGPPASQSTGPMYFGTPNFNGPAGVPYGGGPGQNYGSANEYLSDLGTPSAFGQRTAAAEAPAGGVVQGGATGSGGAAADDLAGVPIDKIIKSPFVGTFYRASSPGSEPFIEVGDRVKKGSTLCIVEAMKLMNEIEAECDGVIRKILVDNEQPVEFDQPLFILD